VGDKERLGDNRTPEGLFHIDDRNAQSRYHLALHISYPDPVHLARARALGVPPGGDIMIHGLPKGLEFVGAAHRADDWTNGCIAVTNQEIDEIWRVVPTGTQIRILP
jgi:murein L,D-transpeptidase YafK